MKLCDTRESLLMTLISPSAMSRGTGVRNKLYQKMNEHIIIDSCRQFRIGKQDNEMMGGNCRCYLLALRSLMELFSSDFVEDVTFDVSALLRP